ncbi:MAG: DUF47 family protein [Desulfurococcaceae archaeon]
MSTWSWISGRREREVLLHSIEHLTIIRHIAEHMKNMALFIRNKEFDKATDEYRNIFRLEKNADDIKRRLIDELSKGVFHPLDREDLLRLVLTCDDIAAYIKSCGKKLEIIIEAKQSIPDEFIEYYIDVSSNITNAVDYIIESIKHLPSSINKAIEYTHKIEEIEEKIDEYRYEFLKKIVFKFSDKIDIHYLLLKEAIDDLEMASDKCEDVGDIIRTIAVSHS